ncbi:MAG: hypothetical protein HOV94_16275 [Saccharothrix sp.]|nr:hypothetical protein [Saccharothrix sp.]
MPTPLPGVPSWDTHLLRTSHESPAGTRTSVHVVLRLTAVAPPRSVRSTKA